MSPSRSAALRDGTLFDDLQIIDAKIVPTVGNEDWAVTVEFKVDEDLVDTCAFGIIYVLGLLSFHDGRPRGVSGKGQAATRWVDRLRGKKFLQPVAAT